ncbi:alpha/beta hydrolase [Fragilaria crotonensis]|nr:alpha/beta hydrolase [Fragilaria crotonensis]
MRACTDRGWAAVGVNFRGCGGVPLATPRGYTGAYTGDMRGVVQILSGRLEKTPQYRIFLVGNSLGANLVAKYLGEEGLEGGRSLAVWPVASVWEIPCTSIADTFNFRGVTF